MPNSPSIPRTFYPAYCFPLSPTHNTWARLTASDVHALRERTGFEGQNLYFHLNHPIKWVRLVGVIVALDIYPTRWIALLDDSSGATIEITCGRPGPAPTSRNAHATSMPESAMEQKKRDALTKGISATGRAVDLSGVDIGTVVKVKGAVGSFRDVRQMLLERICTSLNIIYKSAEPEALILWHTSENTDVYPSTAIIRTTNEEVAAWAENSAFRREILSRPWVVEEGDEKRARRKAEGLEREKRTREKRTRKGEKEDRAGRAGVEKERRRGERKRNGQEHRHGGDESGVLNGRPDAERKDRQRGVEKARKTKV